MSSGQDCPLHPLARSTASQKASESTRPPLWAAPPLISGFSALTPLASGGFGVVYAASRDSDGAQAAIKVALSRDPQFARESEAMYRLGRGIAPGLWAVGRTADDRPWLAMERLSGHSLAHWLEALPAAGVPSLSEARGVFTGLCEVVDRMHERGVLHRDLKPENVFLKEDGAVVLLDFGLAQFTTGAERDLAAPNERPGSVEYMAPEQCTGVRELTIRADVYALGVMLFELLTGRLPFTGDRVAIEQGHVSRRPPRPSEVASSFGVMLSAAVDDVVQRALAKAPADRFTRASELSAALSAALAQGPQTARRPRASEARPRSRTVSMALLGLRTRASPAEIDHALGENGTVLRATADRCVIGFPLEASATQGVRAALALASRLPPWAELIVVHCADMRVREGSRRVTVAGEAIDQLDGWWPASATNAQRVLVSQRAAALLGSGATAATAVPGFVTPVTDAQAALADRPSLHGRDEVLQELLADAKACRAERTPHLVTVTGEVGVGKTRLLEALGERLEGATVLIKSASADAGLRRLVAIALELNAERCTVDEVRVACQRRVGAEAEQAWPAVACALGLLTADDPAVKPIAAASGALRHLVALAVGRGLCVAAAAKPLSVLLDDAHLADPTTLDALELATATAGRVPLWVCVTAVPGLLVRRSSWGERASHAPRRALAALDNTTATVMVGELLRPVEHVPLQVVEHLLKLTGGVPLYLVEVVNSLRISGAIRLRPGTTSWYVAADELLAGSATPVADQLALRALSGLTGPLLSLARLCAVLGEQVEPAEVTAVQRLLEGPERDELEAGVGLARLTRGGLLRTTNSTSFVFRHPLLREAVERLTPAELRIALHDTVRRWLSTHPEEPGSRLRLAHHAAASGAKREAAAAYLALGEEARKKHLYVDAERSYSSALAQLGPGDDLERKQVLEGRGSVRFRVNRLHEALEDLRAARALAERDGDEEGALSLRLEEAEVLDWGEDWRASEAVVRGSASLAARVNAPLLTCRMQLALGRSLTRNEHFEEAIELLTVAARSAAELGDHATHVVSLLMLTVSLIHFGRVTEGSRLQEAEERWQQLIDLCERAGDRLHLGAAFANRILLWQRTKPEQAEADLRRALEISREIGHAQMERVTQFNLAELLLWSGALEEALSGARRAREIQARYYPDPSPDDTLLVARIQLARGERDDARALALWAKEHCPEKTFLASTRVLSRIIELQLDPPADASLVERWRELLTEARGAGFGSDALVEVLYNAATAIAAAGDAKAAAGFVAEALEAGGPVTRWRPRLLALEQRVGTP